MTVARIPQGWDLHQEARNSEWHIVLAAGAHANGGNGNTVIATFAGTPEAPLPAHWGGL